MLLDFGIDVLKVFVFPFGKGEGWFPWLLNFEDGFGLFEVGEMVFVGFDFDLSTDNFVRVPLFPHFWFDILFLISLFIIFDFYSFFLIN